MEKPIKVVRADSLRQTYTLPEIYDIAFDFRNVPQQVDFLLDIAETYLGRKVDSALEMACGPGYHTREMARRGLKSDGLDLEPNMVAYTQKLVDEEGLSCIIHKGDMRTFTSDKKYDLVYCLMASFAQLETNDDILNNFACAADLLTDGGIYIISTAHPRDFFGDDQASAKINWTMNRGYTKVDACWGGDNQQFDPMTEVDDIVVSFTVTTPLGTTRYEFPDRYRRCSIMTFDALMKLSGRFDIVDLYGDFDKKLKLSNDPVCWRFIPILKKK
jgi:SAM-dependent methyltransferase